jgi:putative phosphonate metabolism protein
MTPRYAIYFAPAAGSPWWDFGSAWLGYDARRAIELPQPAIAGVPAARFAALTAAPRRYGFHATLKAPMHLSAGTDAAALAAALSRFASTRAPFVLPPLRLARMDGFLACVPESHDVRVHALADECVHAFDAFRAPPAAAELARRNAAGLDARQAELLARWGYPHVFERFRFHMTLTGRLDGEPDDEVRAVTAAATAAVAALSHAPLICDAVCLFVQASADARFVLMDRFAFGA